MGLHGLHLDVIIGAMLHKKSKKEPDNATHASVKKEMAKPRMARSARIAELNLDTARTPEQPSAVMPGTVDKIIPSPRPSQSGKGGDRMLKSKTAALFPSRAANFVRQRRSYS
jgi:hypothetical protein